MKDLLKLKRNDIAGAIAYFKKQVMAGKWTPDHSTLLARLQDDPTKLMKEIGKLSKEPAIKAAIKKGG